MGQFSFLNKLVIFLIVGLFFLFTSTLVDQYLPGEIGRIFLTVSFGFIIVSGLLMNNWGMVMSVFKWGLIITAPFWIWTVASSVLQSSPLMVYWEDYSYETVENITISLVPTVIAFLGWVFFMVARWQPINRAIITPAALIGHFGVMAYFLINGQLEQVVMAWSLLGLSISLFLNTFMSQPQHKSKFEQGAILTFISSMTLFVYLLMIG